MNLLNLTVFPCASLRKLDQHHGPQGGEAMKRPEIFGMASLLRFPFTCGPSLLCKRAAYIEGEVIGHSMCRWLSSSVISGNDRCDADNCLLYHFGQTRAAVATQAIFFRVVKQHLAALILAHSNACSLCPVLPFLVPWWRNSWTKARSRTVIGQPATS